METNHTQTEFRFVIQGNPDDPNGNPIPKLKMTGKQHWLPRAQRYVAWRNHIQHTFFEHLKQYPDLFRALIQDTARTGRPLNTSKSFPATMDIVIHWRNDTHGDPENIFGAIADALFKQDKYLYGSFRPGDSRDGKVEVFIKLGTTI